MRRRICCSARSRSAVDARLDLVAPVLRDECREVRRADVDRAELRAQVAGLVASRARVGRAGG